MALPAGGSLWLLREDSALRHGCAHMVVCACVCARTTSVVMSTAQNTLQDPSGWVGQWTLFHLISHNAANSVAC